MGMKRATATALTMLAVLVAGALAAGTVWFVSAATARSKVEVLIGADAFDCKNPKDVTKFDQSVGVNDESVYPIPALFLSQDLDCTFSVIVNNAGDKAVRLTGLSIIGVGEGSGNGAQMPRLTMNNIERVADEAAAANFTLDQELAPGDSTTISAVVTRGPGCMSVGGGMSTDRTPTVTLSALGLSGSVSHQGPSFALLGTKHSSCDT